MTQPMPEAPVPSAVKTTPRLLHVVHDVEGAEPRAGVWDEYRPARISVDYREDDTPTVELGGPRLPNATRVGWEFEVLRASAPRTGPDWVREFVEAHRPEWAQP